MMPIMSRSIGGAHADACRFHSSRRCLYLEQITNCCVVVVVLVNRLIQLSESRVFRKTHDSIKHPASE